MANRILGIDIGNTNIVIAVHDGNSWGDELRVKTRSKKAVSDVCTILKDIKCDKAVLSSVVPNITGSILEAVRKVVGLEPLVITRDISSMLTGWAASSRTSSWLSR